MSYKLTQYILLKEIKSNEEILQLNLIFKDARFHAQCLSAHMYYRSWSVNSREYLLGYKLDIDSTFVLEASSRSVEYGKSNEDK